MRKGQRISLNLESLEPRMLLSAPPVVTDANIAALISTDAGKSGVAGIGDIITVAWNNSAGGDNNSNIASVTANLSAFGGGTAVTMRDDGTNGDTVAGDNVWMARIVVAPGNIDATGRNASVTATDTDSNSTTTADTSNISVDNIAPVVTDAKIAVVISTDGGTTGVANVGDVIKVTWNNSAAGDNNPDISKVLANLTGFGGPAAAAMNDSGTGGDTTAGDGIWTVQYTIQAGNVDNAAANVLLSATDDGGNVTTTADTSGVLLNNGPVATYTSGSTTVSAYDVTGTGTFDQSDIRVKFLKDDGVRSITLRGSSDMTGLGLVVSGAPIVEHIRDHRSGAPSDISFIAADSSVESVKLKNGATGFNLNGQTLGGITFAADIDSDANTTDATAFYSTDGLGHARLRGDVSGDAFLGGTGMTGRILGRWLVNGGDMMGDMDVLGDAGKIRVAGGNLGGNVTVTGDLHKLAVARDGGVGGALVAGTNVTVQGQLWRGHIDSYATDNSSVTYGLDLGSLGARLRVGSKFLHQADLPFDDGDFEVAIA